MNTYSVNYIPEFPKEILSESRRNILENRLSDAKRLREKLFSESFDNFRHRLDHGISLKKVKMILQFFTEQRVSVTLENFEDGKVDIRLTSPVVNTITRMHNPESIMMLCEVLHYPNPKTLFRKKRRYNTPAVQPCNALPKNKKIESNKEKSWRKSFFVRFFGF